MTEQCAKHTTVKTIPWYKTWELWMSQNLLRKTRINSVTTIIVSDLSYNQQTIKAVVVIYLQEIHLITSYIDI